MGRKNNSGEEVRRKAVPRHLLVFRTSAMGDVAMLPHALRALKARYPEVRVTVATQPQFKPFFKGLDVEFLDVDVRGEHHPMRKMWHLAAEMRRRGVDAVADVHGVLRSRIVTCAMKLHGIAIARIDKGRKEKESFIEHRGHDMAPLRHTVLRYCDVFRELGYVFDDPQPVTRVSRPNPFGEKQGVWIGFAPFSAQPGKTYPEDLSQRAVELLAARYDRVFIHSGGGEEQRFAEEMERRYPNVTALFGKVRFDGEIDLIANLDCVVSMDSLVMHLASLVATPVVSVWGATHPSLGFLGYGTSPAGILQPEMPCRPCSVFGNRPCHYGDFRCMREIAPEQIVERVGQLIGR